MAMYVVEAEISGKGPFPLDMLRYDACYPKTSQDVSTIHSLGNPTFPPGVALRKNGWTVYLRCKVEGKRAAATAFTVDRWKSFGCTVRVIV